jgi:hypothetical protein
MAAELADKLTDDIVRLDDGREANEKLKVSPCP